MQRESVTGKISQMVRVVETFIAGKLGHIFMF
jgi:hypothetical protein